MKKLLLLILVLTSVFFQPCFGQKKLIVAIDAKDVEKVEKVLKNGADPNADIEKYVTGVGYNCNTPLTYIIREARPEYEKSVKIVELLLTYDADPNFNNTGYPYLFEAIDHDELEIIKLLIKHGADVNVKYYSSLENRTYTLLDYAYINKSKFSDEMSAAIIHGGISLDENNIGGEYLLNAANSNRTKVVDALLQQKVDPGYSRNNSEYPITLAADKGYSGIVKLLGAAGADINVKQEDGETALILAVQKNHIETVRTLLELKADFNVKDNYDRSALYHAIWEDPEIAKMLLEAGAEYSTSVDKFNPMLKAINGEKEKFVSYLLDDGMDPNGRNKEGVPYLCLAAKKGNLEITKKLVAAGADINAVSAYNDLRALFYAVDYNNEEIIKYLLEIGVEVNFKTNNNYGDSPLTLAVYEDGYEIVELLLKKGADPYFKRKYGKSMKNALEFAIILKRYNIQKLLEQYMNQ